MKWFKMVAVIGLMMVLGQAGPALAAQELTVSAAASLSNAFSEIGQIFFDFIDNSLQIIRKCPPVCIAKHKAVRPCILRCKNAL